MNIILKIDMKNNYVIQRIETQGRYGNGTGREYTQYYFIDYWRNLGNNIEAADKWIRYKNLIGNQVRNNFLLKF